MMIGRQANEIRLLKLLAFLFFGIISIVIVQALNTQQVNAVYDGGRLIDNSVFLDAQSMSASQIQSFLASKGGGIANKSFVINCDIAGTQAKQIYLSLGAPCDQTIPASQIIYYASQVYGLNPKVVLATLQKEQSLITSPNPTDRQYAQAMGYGCPTSGSCSDSSNFFWQIDNGTWVLRFHYERARGNMNWWFTSSSWTCGTEKNLYKPNLYPGQNVSFHDTNGVHYRTVYIYNAATSSMYCYTPHTFNNHRSGTGPPQNVPAGTLCYSVHPESGNTGQCYTGSFNFVKFYELWFGTTLGTPLVRTATNPTYYLLTNNRRYAIPSGDILHAYGLERMSLTFVSDDYLNSVTDGGMLSTIFTNPGDGTVFMADGGKKYGITSGTYCVRWGLACGNASVQKEIGGDISDTMANGGVLQSVMKFQARYYLMEAGKKREFLSAQSLQERGYSDSSSTPVANWTNAIRDFDISLPQNNTFVKFSASNAIYFYSSANYYSIPDFDTFLAWFGPNGVSHLDSRSSYNQTPPATAGALNQLIEDGGEIYALTRTNKLRLEGADPTVTVIDVGATSNLKTFLSSRSVQVINSSKALAFPWGTISALIDNTLRPIPTLTDLHLSYEDSTITSVPSVVASAYPTGKLFVVNGRIFKPTDSNGSMYLLGEDDYLWALGSLNELNSALRWNGNVINAPFSLVDHDGIKVFTATVKVGAIYYAVQADGTLRPLPDAILTTNKDLYAMPLTNPVAARATLDSRSLGFIRFDNGTIFKIDGSEIRPIGSFATYSNLGGTAANTTQVSVKAVPMFTVGTVIP